MLALCGSQVVTASPGIGHVGIVVDNQPTRAPHGIVGDGNASVTIRHAYGNVALALSAKAPSVFAGISGGGLNPSHHTRGALRGDAINGDGSGDLRCPGGTSRPSAVTAVTEGSGRSAILEVDAQLPETLEWMRPLASALDA